MFIPEPPEPFRPGNLFLKPYEIIHSKQDGLWYNINVRVVECQDWHDSSESSDDGTPPDRFNSSDDEDYPGFHQRSRKGPWPKRTRFDDGEGGSGSGAGGGPSLGPGWGPPFAEIQAWSLKSPLRFYGRNLADRTRRPPDLENSGELDGNTVVNVPKGFQFDADLLAVTKEKDHELRLSQDGDPMLLEVCGKITGQWGARARRTTNQDGCFLLSKCEHHVCTKLGADPMVREAALSDQSLLSKIQAEENCSSRERPQDVVPPLGCDPGCQLVDIPIHQEVSVKLPICNSGQPDASKAVEAVPSDSLVDVPVAMAAMLGSTSDMVAPQVEAELAAECAAVDTPKTARTDSGVGLHTGDTKKRKTHQEIKTSRHQAGSASPERTDEAPGNYLLRRPAGRRCLPALPGGLHFHPDPLPM